MFSVAVKHMSSSGQILASRVMGASGGVVKPVRKHYELAMSYRINEGNGSPATTVDTVFPSGKYGALDYTPTWAHHRFGGWFESAAIPTTAVPTGTTISPSDSVVYGRSDVYARWQLPATVNFDATSGGGQMPGGWTAPDYYIGQPYGSLPSPTHPTLNFTGWYDGSMQVVGSSVIGSTPKNLVARYESQSYTVDISNGDWEMESPNTNPDVSAYDGVYRNSRYWNSPPGTYADKLYIDVLGYTSFKVYIRSNAEVGWSYTVAVKADHDPTSFTDAINNKQGATSSNNTSTAISGYTLVTYTLDGGSHRICIVYGHKDSVKQNDDRGYLLIPRQQ